MSILQNSVFKIYLHGNKKHFFFAVLGVTQGLHLESIHQPFFVMGFFKIESRELFA
jgi:hypothetical protein